MNYESVFLYLDQRKTLLWCWKTKSRFQVIVFCTELAVQMHMPLGPHHWWNCGKRVLYARDHTGSCYMLINSCHLKKSVQTRENSTMVRDPWNCIQLDSWNYI